MSAQIIFMFARAHSPRSASIVAGATAAIVPFPSVRHARHLTNIVARMSACGDFDAAQKCLASHLDVLWDRLDEIGVAPEASERDCRRFVAAALALYYHHGDDDGWGAA